MRRPRFLQGNKGSPLPQNCVWLDTETRPVRTSPAQVKHVLRFGWACYQRQWGGASWSEPVWKRFTKPREAWEWIAGLTRPKTRLYVFAHNWAFDGPVLDVFDALPALGFELRTAIVESPPVILIFRSRDRVVELVDTLNWWRQSLKSVGKHVGVAKLDMPPGRASRKRWDHYCKTDVEVIRAAMHGWWSFLERHDLGGFARTLAGQAMRAYRHRFMSHQILIDADPLSLELSRESYHGGRTECFRLGRVEGPVHCLDVNSMYPHVMREHAYPAVLRARTARVTLPELERWLRSYCVVARVRIETKEPLFAYRQRDKLVFPVGRLRLALTTPDLQLARDRGLLRGVETVALYEPARLFEPFVEQLYALRQEAEVRGDEVERYQLKILMNSLYGKFAQRGTVWQPAGSDPEHGVGSWVEVDAETGATRVLRRFGGIVQRLADEPESWSSHPAIASHVTAHARRLLWSFVERAGPEHVFYCDTDSLYLDGTGLDRLAGDCDGKRLGALKHEATHAWMHFHGAKDYAAPGVVKAKGVSGKARWLDASTVEQEHWSSLPGLIRTGSLKAPRTTRLVKVLGREYTKGRTAPDGTVSPLRVDDW